MYLRFISILGVTLLLISCSKDKVIYEPTKRSDPYKIYMEAYEAFEKNDFFFASKKFSEAELNFKDPSLKLNLPKKKMIISKKDSELMNLSEFKKKYKYL